MEGNTGETKYLASSEPGEDKFTTGPVWQAALCSFLGGVFSSVASSHLICSGWVGLLHLLRYLSPHLQLSSQGYFLVFVLKF